MTEPDIPEESSEEDDDITPVPRNEWSDGPDMDTPREDEQDFEGTEG